MFVLDEATYIEANPANFSTNTRPLSDIGYIVVHYTGNIGDTARNNAIYFRDNAVSSGAHIFVSEETVYQSVPFNHAAFSVGLGKRKEPYFKYPSMWRIINNNNSVSVEICGSKNSREATDTTKKTAARIIAKLLKQFNLTPAVVYRHYDVTGKVCPAWAVEDEMKWLEFRSFICNYYYGEGVQDDMQDTPENFDMFKKFMTRYLDELALTDCPWAAEAMAYCKARGLINDGRPNSNITRAELATVLMRMNA